MIGATWFNRGAGDSQDEDLTVSIQLRSPQIGCLEVMYQHAERGDSCTQVFQHPSQKLELKNTCSDQSRLAMSFKSFRFKLNSRLRTLEDSEVYDSIVMNIS